VSRKRFCMSLPCHSERSPRARQRLRTESRNLMHGRGVEERDPSTSLRFARDDRHCPVIPSEAACLPPAGGSRRRGISNPRPSATIGMIRGFVGATILCPVEFPEVSIKPDEVQRCEHGVFGKSD
jgi:hypothetical protein